MVAVAVAFKAHAVYRSLFQGAGDAAALSTRASFVASSETMVFEGWIDKVGGSKVMFRDSWKKR